MIFISYRFFATYHDGSGHEDYGNIFLDSKEPKCEEDIYALEAEIRKDIKNRIGFDRSTVTILNFKEVK